MSRRSFETAFGGGKKNKNDSEPQSQLQIITNMRESFERKKPEEIKLI